ncbi:MAG: M56 family metallopeptidase [Rikenellaceae bacterium]|nr:M56 family metallopeptidase [Rikenellaceae bacterium]
MHTTIITLAEIIATSSVLYLAYRWLFDGKADYRFCRLYLVMLPYVSLLLPLLEIPIYPAEVVWIQSESEHAIPAADAFEWLTPHTILLTIYLVGAIAILSAGILQLRLIDRIRRAAIRIRHEHYTLYRSRIAIRPFSFLRSIFIHHATDPEMEPMILTHEASHIRRGHTLERPFSEFSKVLMWWNPITWLTAIKLIEVEEEEADRDVLQAGFKLKFYMQSIFKIIFGFNPSIANQYPQKQIKKRFLALSRQYQRTKKLWQKALLVPIVALLMGIFSFTQRPTEYRLFEASTTSLALEQEEIVKEVEQEFMASSPRKFPALEEYSEFNEGVSKCNFREQLRRIIQIVCFTLTQCHPHYF